MVLCLSCGAPNPLEAARFCVHCGARLPARKPSEQAEVKMEPPQPPPVDPPQRQVPVLPPTPPSMKRPPPPSVRASNEKSLTASSSYSFVSERQSPRAAKGAERPTLPGGGSPSAPLWPMEKPPASMAEAIARVSPVEASPDTRPGSQDPSAVPEAKPKSARRPMYGPPPSSPAPSPEQPRRDSSPRRGVYSAPTRPNLTREAGQVSARGSTPFATEESSTGDLSWDEPAPPPKPEVPASVFGLRKSSPPGPPPVQDDGPTVEITTEGTFDLDQSATDPASPLESAEGAPDSVDALLDDIDAGFDRIVESPGSARNVLSEHEAKEVHELFSQIAVGHMRPVRDFMIELGLGDPPREWLDLVTPSVASLAKSAEGMGMTELRDAAGVFREALETVGKSGEPRITSEQRKELTDAFELLAAELPGAFDLSEERDRREPIIVQSLLRQIPDVRKVALDKLYSAGLTALEMYYAAQPYDIAQAAGLSEDLAARIVKRFAQYRRETSIGAPDLERSHEHKKLALLVARLAQQNEAFDTASKSWSKKAERDKKRVRKERSDTVLELNVLLARLGEVELVQRMEKMAFQAKVEALTVYMNEFKERAGSDQT